MSRATRLAAVLLALASGASACQKGGGAAAAGPVEYVEATLELPEQSLVDRTSRVTVTLRLPRSWRVDDFFQGQCFLPRGPSGGMKLARLEARTGCNGACDAAAIPGQLEQLLEQPGATLGDDADQPTWKPTIEVLERGDLPQGRFVAYRFRFPPQPEQAEVVPIPGLDLLCYLHDPGDAFYVELAIHADQPHENEVWPALLETCRSASYSVTPVS